MAVRVGLRIGSNLSDTSIISSAVLNSGFETAEPQVLLPERAAYKLNFLPSLPKFVKAITYGTAAGPTKLYKIPKALRISLNIEKKTKEIVASAVISKTEDEIILSNQTISKLNISIIDPAKGMWRVRNEKKLRKSIKPKYW